MTAVLKPEPAAPRTSRQSVDVSLHPEKAAAVPAVVSAWHDHGRSLIVR